MISDRASFVLDTGNCKWEFSVFSRTKSKSDSVTKYPWRPLYLGNKTIEEKDEWKRQHLSLCDNNKKRQIIRLAHDLFIQRWPFAFLHNFPLPKWNYWEKSIFTNTSNKKIAPVVNLMCCWHYAGLHPCLLLHYHSSAT